MRFNQGQFNRSAYNRDLTQNNILIGAVVWNHSLTITQNMWSIVPLNGNITKTFSVSGAMTALANLPSGTANKKYTVSGIMMALCEMSGAIETTYTLSGQLDVANTASFTLTGLNLQPGQIIVIDTDLLQITVNGVEDVNCWQSGGEFFKLAPGENTIQVYTDAQNAGNSPSTVEVSFQSRWF